MESAYLLDNGKPVVLEADIVYLLMKKGFPISRNVRAQWLLKYLDAIISIQPPKAEIPELEIVSVIPKEVSHSWCPETSHRYSYKVTSSTTIKFLAHKYRMVFSLDLSPSLASVDTQNGEIVIDELSKATKRCLEGLTRPFLIPGSKRKIQPEVYVTVIIHTPFFTNPAQVIVQGWLVTKDNVNNLMQVIEAQLNILEEKVAYVTNLVNLQLETLRSESERLVGGLFEESGPSINKSNASSTQPTPAMVSPETGFVNILRYGMLALSLLPEYSCAHLVIVTDGIVGVSDVHALESVIQQLRATTIACSFLHVGSSYHPHSANGLVPYPDLLRFLATATLGSYMTDFPLMNYTEEKEMNAYQKNLLCSQLHRTDNYEVRNLAPNTWQTKNNLFYGHEPPQLLRKKQIDHQVTCTLNSLLCCRLREGYLIKKATIRDGCLEICFVLPWKSHVFIEYMVTCPRFMKSLSICNTLQYTITIEAPYDFLHDITCLSKKPLKSQYRHNMVSQFWGALTSLTESNSMLSHFSWFPGMGWSWYNVPDTIRSGMPVFNLPTSSSSSIQLSDAACPQFGQIWQPVVSLEPTQWPRWLHSQRVTLILIHDRPLSKHLHQANQSGRFQSVQFRQSATVLWSMLKTWATFVLVENQIFVQFIYKEPDKPPISFSLINVTCKSLCVVLNVAFAGGTEGQLRHNVMVDLLERLSQLTLPSRRTEQREIPCCIIMHKALEKILIRYERMPIDLSTVIFPDGSQIMAKSALIAKGNLTTTLSRYLYHHRWLWLLKKPALQVLPATNLPKLSITAVARILSTITKIRLAEGFNFAYSASGIMNTVMEVQMKGPENNDALHPCLVQYILFPPHVVVTSSGIEKDSGTEEETTEGTVDGENGLEDNEATGDFQIVMEAWIEPQCGHVRKTTAKKAAYMHSLQYDDLPEAISNVDRECINALLTLEHLSLMCQSCTLDKSTTDKLNQQQQATNLPTNNFNNTTSNNNNVNNTNNNNNNNNNNKSQRRPTFPTEVTIENNPIVDDRIRSMQFEFDILGILPKFQQAELLFSMFADDYNDQIEVENSANKIFMDGFLSHIKNLHNRELILSAAESDRFMKMLAARPRDENAKNFYCGNESERSKNLMHFPRWRCFIKGISTTHVIVTMVPATESDVHLMTDPEEVDRQILTTPIFANQTDSTSEHQECKRIEIEGDITPPLSGGLSPEEQSHAEVDVNSEVDFLKHFSSLAYSTPKKTENYETKAPSPSEGNSRRGLILPVYVYDCSLALLVDSLIEKLDKPAFKDVYKDHTYNYSRAMNDHPREEILNLKSGENTKPPSPEPKSEDSDNVSSDQRILMDHCKVLNFAHCHSYVFAVYKSLVLQQSISNDEIEAAVEQCEENVIEINITEYLQAVCRHLGSAADEISPCNEMRNIHNLIIDKFKKIINVAFRQAHRESYFYYCLPSWKTDRLIDTLPQASSDSDDDVRFSFNADFINGKVCNSLKKVNHFNSYIWSSAMLHEAPKRSNSLSSTDSFLSDIQMDFNDRDQPPLFLQLNCSIRSKSSNFFSNPVKLLPTCFAEIVQELNEYNLKDTSDLKVTLDIICLYLSKEILEVSIENTPAGLRTTSYCSDGSNRYGTEYNDQSFERLQSFDPENIYDGLSNLPKYHYNALFNLKKEINWLLQDETAAVLLDKPMPSETMLNFVSKHVADSNNRTSCYLDRVPLKFVFPSESSLPKFLDELKKLTIDRYCIRQHENYFYFVKDPTKQDFTTENEKKKSLLRNIEKEENFENEEENSIYNFEDIPFATSTQLKKQDSGDPPGYHSEISSIGDNHIGTEDGYEGDSSNSEDECQWLIDLDHRRDLLPNFWLILRVEDCYVNIYFHCRFLELNSPEVQRYQQVQKNAVIQIKSICRRVNQYLLLRDLHDKRTCSPLLESESMDDGSWKRVDADTSIYQNTEAANTGTNFPPGMFKCPVVWEVPFTLHHRLKTGPGKSGLSRGIAALQSVLNRFSVNNRTNMFVYQEKNGNVFYLRLQERTNDDRLLQSNKLSESDEKLMVSRSSSIASLSQGKISGSLADQSSFASAMDQLRPRVKSFGEKESDLMNKSEDSIILLVHGISDVGPEVRNELVQVLQNRLDEKVLEQLYVTITRNPMCKLSPSDVHFIQKPYRGPESVIRLSVQDRCLQYMDALGHYLRQNILQFLYMPKYTDPRPSSHFQDYSQPDGSSKRVPESDIYLYNQSLSNQSGNLGLACIAIAIVDDKGNMISTDKNNKLKCAFTDSPEIKEFEQIVFTNVYWGPNCEKSDTQHTTPKAYIEFRIWKQGRVNLESLVQKLKSAVKHANWDLITEFSFLPMSLSKPLEKNIENIDEPTKDPNLLETNLNCYETGEKGKLNEIYHKILPYWLQFGLNITVPAIKKHVVNIEKRHALPVILKELQNLIHNHALDTTTRTFVQSSRQPFINKNLEDEILLGKGMENVEGNLKWLIKVSEKENNEDVIFLPYDITKDTGTPVKSIIVARNFKQWKASCSNNIESEELNPKDQKLLQRFVPQIFEKSFVPRQRLLLAEIQSHHIILYIYNWSKERSEKLIKQVTNLGHWLSSRSSLHSSIIMQKLGIFHHQPMRNYDQDEQSQITDMNSLAKFPSTSNTENKDWQKNRTGSQTGSTWNQFMGQIMRDAKPSGQYPINITDPVVKAAYDFQELRHKEKKTKEDLNKLLAIWQSRGPVPNVPISQATLNTFKQHSRLIHYCHTPLLFLPTWRLQSAATRDHSLTPPLHHAASGSQQRSRTTSNASTKKMISEWHHEICASMLSEYKQYLQILGFNPITIETAQKTEGESVLKQICYLKKTMLGGVLLFEIHLNEPFFIVKLRVIECSRLQAKSSMVNQFMLSFLDACDKVKINMHLHSFTYDFHLRCIHSYIAGNCQWSLKHGYHLTNFLDDFNKYYSKAPNYARNLIYSGIITVSNLITPAHTLYQYLLSHEKTYGMQVFSMSDDADSTEHNEYVLVKLQTTPRVSYHDAHDTRCTDDFDVAFIVTWLEQFSQPESREITLKYYLMLTSKRELYPKRDTESTNKIGKFKTVYNIVRIPQMDSPSESSPASLLFSPSYMKQLKNENESLPNKTLIENTSSNLNNSINEVIPSLAPTPPPVPDSPLAPQALNSSTTSCNSGNLSQIRQESINYLGYYSSHEQLMQELIISQANEAQVHIRNMIEQGALHCRTHLLWNRLLESKSPMTYAEFTELRSLACVEPLSKIDQRLSPLVNQPIGWYQGLAKVLQNKYQEYHKQFNAPDGNIMYHLILHPNYVQAFMMLTIDLHTSRGELYAVYRKSEEIISTPFSIGDIYSLIEDFVNACCFHLWLGLYS